MEQHRGNSKVVWFSINIKAQGYAMGDLQRNLFTLPSDPAHQWLLYRKTNFLFHISNLADVSVRKKDMNMRGVQRQLRMN